MAGLAATFGSGAMTNSIADLEESQCILVIGSDTTSQHPLIARRIIRAKEKGAKLIVCDPKAIQLSTMADLYLPLTPGTNLALLNGMAKVIIEEGLEDKDFIEKRTEGFSELKELLDTVSLKEVEEITGVPEEQIRQAVRLYATAEKAAIVYCMGITQHTTGTENVMAIAHLSMLTGNIGRPGTGINPLRGQNNVQGACDMGALPNVLPGYQSVSDAGVRDKIAQIWGVSELPSKPGLTVMEMIEAATQKKVKAMYIMGENPMVSDPDLKHVEESLKQLDFLVVQDIFLTETGRLAHVVLPSACFAEKEGTFTNTERRVQRVRKAISPPGDAREDSEIICKLAEKLGASNGFSFRNAQEVFEEIRKVTPSYAGMTYERLNTPSGLQWPCPTGEHPGTRILHREQFTRGKGKFHPAQYKKPKEEPDQEYPYTLTTGRIIFQYHTGSMTRRSPALNDEAPEGYIEINPQDAKTVGIKEGEMVGVESRRGMIETKTKISKRIKPGVVFIPFHFAESAANVLTNPALDPISKIPEYKVCAVRIKKINET